MEKITDQQMLDALNKVLGEDFDPYVAGRELDIDDAHNILVELGLK